VPDDSSSPESVRRIVVVGASAGGVEALRVFVAALPADLPAAVVVVLHIPPDAPSALAAILGRAGPLPARSVVHGDRLTAGTVYVAPADHHVLVVDGHLHLSRGPRENGHRPALDPLFRSAAVEFGPFTIGVVLSGNRDDGAAGLAVIARQGGATFVQDPAEALYAGMPHNAVTAVPSSRVHRIDELGAAVGKEVEMPGPTPSPPPEFAAAEAEMATAGSHVEATPDLAAAQPSGFSCPDCDGVLFRMPGAPHPRFRCRIGHAWSPGSLAAEQDKGIDTVLWAALRALEEKVALQRELATTADGAGHRHAAQRHRRSADETATEAQVLRRLLTRELVGDSAGDSVGDGSGNDRGIG
jgi:two-component system chemotaxis response regulator CheB